MKTIGLLLALFIGLNGNRQDAVGIKPTIYNLAYGKTMTIENIKLAFKNLSADSRCPKEVMCARAGEAIATLKLYKDNKFIKEVQLSFFPHGVVEELTEILEKESIIIQGLKLLPYPVAGNSLSKSNYYIKFIVIPKT